MNDGTLGTVFVKLADTRHTGVLRLDRPDSPGGPEARTGRNPEPSPGPERYVVQWSDGRIVGLTDGDGTPLRSGFGQFLVAGGFISARRLLRERRRAAARAETMEWRLSQAGVPDAQLKRLVGLEARERLLVLMDEGGFTARVVVMPPTPDVWLEPVSVPALVRLWKDRRAERKALRDRLPDGTALFARTRTPPTPLFRPRSVSTPEATRDPYAAQSPVTLSTEAGAAFPPSARLVYLHVDGVRRVRELARAAGLAEHDVGASLLALEAHGLVRLAASEASRIRALPGVGAALATVTWTAVVAALVLAWPPASPLPLPDVDATCRQAQRALAFDYWRQGRYPVGLDALVGAQQLPAAAASLEYRRGSRADAYELPCAGGAGR